MKRTAAVIVTYNRKDLLLECVSAVLGQEGGAPAVIIVDNASSDGTADALRQVTDANKTNVYGGVITTLPTNFLPAAWTASRAACPPWSTASTPS